MAEVEVGHETIERGSDEESVEDEVYAALRLEKEADLKELDDCLAGIEEFCGELFMDVP